MRMIVRGHRPRLQGDVDCFLRGYIGVSGDVLFRAGVEKSRSHDALQLVTVEVPLSPIRTLQAEFR